MRTVILLDFDGVILDSVPIKDEAFLSLFSNYSSEIQAKAKQFWIDTRGMDRVGRIRQGFLKSTGIKPTEKQLASLIERYKERIACSMLHAPWIKGAIEFLSTQHLGPAIIVSAAPAQEVRAVVAERQLDQYIHSVFGGPESKVNNIKTIFTDTQKNIANSIFVGDTLHDLSAAQTLSIPFLGIVKEGTPSPFPEDVPTTSDLRDIEFFLSS